MVWSEPASSQYDVLCGALDDMETLVMKARGRRCAASG